MMNTRSLRFRITAWYAGLLAGTLIVFGASVYLGLERYLDWTLQRTLVAECRTISTELLSQLPAKDTAWLETEINEAYAPEVNGLFIRVVHQNKGVVYLSGAPKDGTFDPWRIPFPSDKEMDGSRKLQFESGNRLRNPHVILARRLEIFPPQVGPLRPCHPAAGVRGPLGGHRKSEIGWRHLYLPGSRISPWVTHISLVTYISLAVH